MTENNASLRRSRSLVGCLVAAIIVSLCAIASPAEAKRITPAFFGMHDSRIGTGVLTDVPIGSVRIWDAGTSWRDIERRPGRFDFAVLDTAVTAALQRGVRPLVVLGQTPRFHALHKSAPGSYGRGATSMPRLNAWKRYVAAVARQYGTTVDYQVWNEPNVVNYWTGSVFQMASLTAAASRTIERVAGAGATVVAPSFPLRLRQQQRWFKAYWHSRVGGRSVADYVDVVSANLYPSADGGPEAAMELMWFAKRALPRSARHKPLWNTEINYGLLGGDLARRIPARRQAAFVARTLVLNAASPVRRVYWYAWDLGPIANTLLARDAGTRRTAAGRAWAVVEGWLEGTNAKGCHQVAAGRLRGVYTCVFQNGPHQVRRVYWKPAGKAVSLRTSRSTRSWSTVGGSTSERRGTSRVLVGQSPILVTSRR